MSQDIDRHYEKTIEEIKNTSFRRQSATLSGTELDWKGLKEKMMAENPNGYATLIATMPSEQDIIPRPMDGTTPGIYPERDYSRSGPTSGYFPPTKVWHRVPYVAHLWEPQSYTGPIKPAPPAWQPEQLEQWEFILKILNSDKPSEHFLRLRAEGVLEKMIPELNRLWGVPQRAEYHPEVDTGVHAMMVLDMAARLNAPLDVRFACLVHDFGKGTTPADVLPRHIDHETRSADLLHEFSKRFPVPREMYDLALMVAVEHGNFHRSTTLDFKGVSRLLMRCNALNFPERFRKAILAAECDARGRLGKEEEAYAEGARLLNAQEAALAVPIFQLVVEQVKLGRNDEQVRAFVKTAYVNAIRQAFK